MNIKKQSSHITHSECFFIQLISSTLTLEVAYLHPREGKLSLLLWNKLPGSVNGWCLMQKPRGRVLVQLDYPRATSISGRASTRNGFPAGHSHGVPGRATEQGFCKQIHIIFDRTNIWLWISGQRLFRCYYQRRPSMLSGNTTELCKGFNSWKSIARMICYGTNFKVGVLPTQNSIGHVKANAAVSFQCGDIELAF